MPVPIKTCHGHVLNVCFSATLWTFHFETVAKCAARYIIGVAEMYVETRISNEPGLHFSEDNGCIVSAKEDSVE